MASTASVMAVDPMQVASATNSIGAAGASAASVSSALGVAGAVSGIASGIFGAINGYNSNKTAAKNAAATAAAIAGERDNTLRIYDRETNQLAADQTLGYIMSGLELGTGGTPEAVMGATASERNIDRNITRANYDREVKNAEAAEAAAKKAADNSLLGGVIQTASTVGALALFSDERLKENLIAIGKSRNGLTIYLGKYTEKSGLDDGNVHLFLSAQEVQKVRPDAVIVADNGYLMVDYKAALI
jgi:hypothetical protein